MISSTLSESTATPGPTPDPNPSAQKTALICGISGQDGAYLAEYLLSLGYRVWGTSRDAQVSALGNLTRLGLRDRLSVISMALNDFRSVLQAIHKTQPDEIYNLAGQTSVGLSFEQPVESIESITLGTLNLLEAIRFTGSHIKLYNAGSTECFGNTDGEPAEETTPFRPRSPYAVAKAAAFWEVANYREAYGLFAGSGLLSNHDSPLRPRRFVTQKIITTACEIAAGRQEKLRLGNLSIARDWGWAPDYVRTMHQMLQQDEPDDFIIATGETHSLEAFVATAFKEVGLDWREWVEADASLLRPTDIAFSSLNPEKARRQLGWQAAYRMPDVVRFMVAARQTDPFDP